MLAICRLFVTAFVVVISTYPAAAQQQRNIPRIGYLEAVSPSRGAARSEAFRQGLRELGYVEGENIVTEYRYAKGKRNRLPALATELVRLKVDVIVTAGASATRAAMKATSTIPIVMAQDSDPVGKGVVASLARPGGNITGLSTLAPEISAKQLDLLNEILPKLSRLAVLGISTRPGNEQTLKEVKLAARTFSAKVQYLDVLDPKDIETAFGAARKERANAILVLAGHTLTSNRKRIAELAAENRIPAVYPFPVYVEAGGLMSYGVRRSDLFRRAATYVVKILEGASPRDLPVQQPTKFNLVVNLKTAKALGITFPPSILLRADKVIE